MLELPATWGEAERVLYRVAQELARGPGTDLVLLPEQSLNGYVSAEMAFDLAWFAEPIDGPTRERVAAIARRQQTMIVAPLVLREEEALYNAVIGVDREGEIAFTYRKHHPWYPERWATPGPVAPSLVTVAGVSVLTAVCYDLHFLEDDAAAALEAADLLLFPSAWVDPDDDRHLVLPALAERHSVVVANANWAEGIVRFPGQGGSAIYGAHGETLASAPHGTRSSIVRLDATLALPQ